MYAADRIWATRALLRRLNIVPGESMFSGQQPRSVEPVKEAMPVFEYYLEDGLIKVRPCLTTS